MEHNFTIVYTVADEKYRVRNDDSGVTYDMEFKSKERAEAFCNEVANKIERKDTFEYPFKVVTK